VNEDRYMGKKRLPHFETEEEELRFWETARPDDYEWEAADDLSWDPRPEKKKPITMRFEPSLIAELKALAEELDMPYQTLTRFLVRRGLHQLRAERAARAERSQAVQSYDG
jgi:predicted DNA binding CopG/RHH family protein